MRTPGRWPGGVGCGPTPGRTRCVRTGTGRATILAPVIVRHELRAVHGRGPGGGAHRARRGRAPDRRGRGRGRGDGRAGARPRRGGERPDRPRRRRRPPRGRPQARHARASPTRRSSRPIEPCAMCVGALLESDVAALVFAVPTPDRRRGRHGHPARPAPALCSAGSRSCSGIRRDEAEELLAPLATGDRALTPAACRRLCYPLPRRGVRVVDGAALEKRCAKAPRVRIPPSPPGLIGPAGRRRAGRLRLSGERSPSGLWRRTGNAVRGNPSRVRIPPSPPAPSPRASRGA